MPTEIVIDKAIVIEAGKTYVIECPGYLSKDVCQRLRDMWARAAPEGARAIILEDGMKIATEQEVINAD